MGDCSFHSLGSKNPAPFSHLPSPGRDDLPSPLCSSRASPLVNRLSYKSRISSLRLLFGTW